jgi:hypothetical protein
MTQLSDAQGTGDGKTARHEATCARCEKFPWADGALTLFIMTLRWRLVLMLAAGWDGPIVTTPRALGPAGSARANQVLIPRDAGARDSAENGWVVRRRSGACQADAVAKRAASGEACTSVGLATGKAERAAPRARHMKAMGSKGAKRVKPSLSRVSFPLFLGFNRAVLRARIYSLA